ncbi:MAG TPA: transglutaminase-like domain-containing protein, partial [Spirochaetota bacterium]|nr:transglutaminase-like domain-containing protein [Spirochaetota bacterium]
MFRLITVLIIYSFISPEIFFFEGKSFNKYYVYFSRNFRPRQNKKTSVSITKPPCCDTGIFNHQHITNYKIKYNSRPLTVTNFRDSYGNKIEKTFFKPQTYRGKNSTISYEISFDAVLDNQVYQVNSDSVFPISNQETALTPFLKEVSGAFFSNTAVQRKAIELTLNSNLAADAVVILTLWVNRKIKEISFNNNTKLPYPVYAYQQRTKGYYKAGEVLQKKQGTFAGKINLLAAMIRSLGIPVRYVRGFSLEEHFDLTPASATNCPVIKKFVPKHENIWLEIWLDDLKWLPVSMRESALVMFPAYIKTRIGNSIKDLINNDYKNLKPVAGDLYFEKKETALTTNNFKICFSLSNYATPYFLPLLNTNSLKKILKHYTDLFKAAAAEFSKKTNSVVKCNSGLHQINEIKIKHGPAQNR